MSGWTYFLTILAVMQFREDIHCVAMQSVSLYDPFSVYNYMHLCSLDNPVDGRSGRYTVPLLHYRLELSARLWASLRSDLELGELNYWLPERVDE